MRAIFEIGRLSFDPQSGDLSTRAMSRRLEPKAASVLTELCSAKGEIVSRQTLLDRCWGEGEGSDEALSQAVAQVRRVLEELGEPADLIETLAKRGYRLNAPPAKPGPIPGRRHDFALGRWVTAALVAVILIVIFADPHAIRHRVRHMLGMGSPSASMQS